MNTKKGFTIIELLVVIAIIAVLAGIVLVNVTSYINKGKDASIKGNLATILTNSAVYFDTNSNYTSFCTAAGYTVPEAAMTATNIGSTVTEVCTATHFCSCATLKTTAGNTYCVDDTGYKKETATACATRCPAGAACTD